MPVRLSYGPQPAQFGELHLPERPAGRRIGVAVVLHGGFWRQAYGLELGRPLAADLAAAGVAAWNVEYRRVGGGGGWPATFADVAAAWTARRPDRAPAAGSTWIGWSPSGTPPAGTSPPGWPPGPDFPRTRREPLRGCDCTAW